MPANLHLFIPVHLNFVSGRKEGVEADDEFGMSAEELGDPSDHSGGVNALGLELLHDIQEVIVHLGLLAKAKLDLKIQMRKL